MHGETVKSNLDLFIFAVLSKIQCLHVLQGVSKFKSPCMSTYIQRTNDKQDRSYFETSTIYEIN